MTEEEAIKILDESKRQNEKMRDNPNLFWRETDIIPGVRNTQKRITALDMAISALRAKQEQGWISVKDGLPENASHLGAFCPRYMVSTKLGITEGWYNPDREAWYVLFWFMTGRCLVNEVDFERGDVPRVVKVDKAAGFVTHWMPIPRSPKGE